MRLLWTLIVFPALWACGDDPAATCVDSTGCPTGQRCVDGECESISPMDGAIDTSAGDTATGDTAVGDTSAPDGGSPCSPVDCDDANECTDDRCTESGCVNENNASACDDGLYCNGLDSCMAGACDGHAGDPCGGLVCNEMTDACDGSCTSDAECPDDVVGVFSSCAGFGSTCDETGMRSRTIATFSCVAANCIGDTMVEMEACTIDTDGTICDDGSPCTRLDRCMGGTCEPGVGLCPPGCSCTPRSLRCVDDRTGELCVEI